jgi:hypothetical protein
LGVYEVFCDETFSFEDSIDSPIGGKGNTQFFEFPFYGRSANLGVRMFFKVDSDIFDQVFHFSISLTGTANEGFWACPYTIPSSQIGIEGAI